MLIRNRARLVEQRVRCGNQLTAIEDVLFPELKDFFKTGVTIPSARLLLESFPTPNHVAAADPAGLHRVVVREGRARGLARRLMALQGAAVDSAGLATDTDAIVQAQDWLLYQLRLLDGQIDQVEAAIGAVLEEWPAQERAVLASFPVMTNMRQAVLLATIGDIANFRDDRQLRKLLGWYPEARQSGSSLLPAQRDPLRVAVAPWPGCRPHSPLPPRERRHRRLTATAPRTESAGFAGPKVLHRRWSGALVAWTGRFQTDGSGTRSCCAPCPHSHETGGGHHGAGNG